MSVLAGVEFFQTANFSEQIWTILEFSELFLAASTVSWRYWGASLKPDRYTQALGMYVVVVVVTEPK